MNSEDILAQLNVIFRNVLDRKDLTLTRETTAADVPEWDSLSHIRLIIAIEKHFAIKFSASEIQNLSNVGDLADRIDAKR